MLQLLHAHFCLADNSAAPESLAIDRRYLKPPTA